ncbi:ABC transporter permease [Saccharibacillus sp. JS10]|uniref:ABC transporter permease n=1 Tax=Saccharibacillus sp. JS10 TaxID=2950552 RepID=UPI002108EBDA|nr:ABC transporter permease subunit [Saccharibacillus sp. JS10]MCQ4088042.1 ABC transporter permease subunit [Saccharibacillus sp. JS10]
MNKKKEVSLGKMVQSEAQRMFKRKRTWAILIAYMICTLLECMFLTMTNTSFYDPQRSVALNSLNTSPFLLRELAVLINFIVIPMLAVDSFNGEVASGALRLALIRPVSRVKIFAVKWLVLGYIIGGLTLFTWAAGTVFGRIAMPSVEETAFIGTGQLDSLGALAFTLGFYALAFGVFLTLIGIGGAVSLIAPNPVLAYIGMLAAIVGGLYVSDRFSFLLTVSDSIFHFIGNIPGGDASLALVLCLLLASCAILGTWSWRAREWTQ